MINYSLLEIKNRLKAQIQLVQSEFENLSPQELNTAANGDQSWSILACVEHLNLYANYYNQELSKAFQQLQGTPKPKAYKLSWLGRKSIEAIRVDNTKKQKTFKRMNPQATQLSPQVLSNFIAHQVQLLTLLEQHAEVNLNKKKIRIEFFKLLRLSIYETLIFMVEHQNRHLQQALRVKNALKSLKESII